MHVSNCFVLMLQVVVGTGAPNVALFLTLLAERHHACWRFAVCHHAKLLFFEPEAGLLKNWGCGGLTLRKKLPNARARSDGKSMPVAEKNVPLRSFNCSSHALARVATFARRWRSRLAITVVWSYQPEWR